MRPEYGTVGMNGLKRITMSAGEITGETFSVSEIIGTNLLYSLIWLHRLVICMRGDHW